VEYDDAIGKGTPRWVHDMENGFVSNPMKAVTIGTVEYSITTISEQHATNDGHAAILFSTDGTKVWGEIQETAKPVLYLGKPSTAQKVAMDKALAE
jgi:hypothetical protein